jgi:hypothetical protein
VLWFYCEYILHFPFYLYLPAHSLLPYPCPSLRAAGKRNPNRLHVRADPPTRHSKDALENVNQPLKFGPPNSSSPNCIPTSPKPHLQPSNIDLTPQRHQICTLPPFNHIHPPHRLRFSASAIARPLDSERNSETARQQVSKTVSAGRSPSMATPSNQWGAPSPHMAAHQPASGEEQGLQARPMGRESTPKHWMAPLVL